MLFNSLCQLYEAWCFYFTIGIESGAKELLHYPHPVGRLSPTIKRNRGSGAHETIVE